MVHIVASRCFEEAISPFFAKSNCLNLENNSENCWDQVQSNKGVSTLETPMYNPEHKAKKSVKNSWP